MVKHAEPQGSIMGPLLQNVAEIDGGGKDRSTRVLRLISNVNR